jgi:hypothetical protein
MSGRRWLLHLEAPTKSNAHFRTPGQEVDNACTGYVTRGHRHLEGTTVSQFDSKAALSVVLRVKQDSEREIYIASSWKDTTGSAPYISGCMSPASSPIV